MNDALAIILARAGSKGLPGKNTALIAGKPCIEWTISTALDSRALARVIVSTDDAEAASIARRSGVSVIDRPPELAQDTATVDAAARHAAGTLGRFSSLVILYANVPIRPMGLIDRAVELLASSGCDSVQSYSPVGKHHPWWTARVGEAGVVEPWEGEVLNNNIFRRQDLPPAYIPDGGVVAVTRRSLMLEIEGVAQGPHAFLGRDRRGVVSPEGSVVDIDTELDLLVADAILSRRASLRLRAG